MQKKTHLTVRLEPALLDRLERVASSRYMEIPDIISAALDALERTDNLDEELALVMEKLELLHQKMSGIDKIRSYFQILEKQLVAHDEAEAARLRRIHGPHIFD